MLKVNIFNQFGYNLKHASNKEEKYDKNKSLIKKIIKNKLVNNEHQKISI